MESSSNQSEFSPGTQVVYGVHGRCEVKGIESRSISGQTIRFYRLEIQKQLIGKPARKDPAIWLPVDGAKRKGLRAPMTADDVQTVMNILSNREFYFSLKDIWKELQTKLERCIEQEGGIGLAKAISALHVLKNRTVVPPSEVVKTFEKYHKLLAREVAEIQDKPIRAIEDEFDEKLREKLKLDS